MKKIRIDRLRVIAVVYCLGKRREEKIQKMKAEIKIT